MRRINPVSLGPARGFSHGVVGSGDVLYVSGQIGWNADQQIVSEDFCDQFAQALDNILVVVDGAGSRPDLLLSMTVFATDIQAYRDSVKQLGVIWKARFGRQYPAMAVVGVTELVEPKAIVEIQSIWELPVSQ